MTEYKYTTVNGPPEKKELSSQAIVKNFFVSSIKIMDKSLAEIKEKHPDLFKE